MATVTFSAPLIVRRGSSDVADTVDEQASAGRSAQSLIRDGGVRVNRSIASPAVGANSGDITRLPFQTR